MKTIFYIFILMMTTMLLNACCTKKDCGTESFEISFINFESSDVKDATVYYYEDIHNTKTLIDSSKLNFNSSDNKMYCRLLIDYKKIKDMKFVFPVLGKEYKLTQFVFRKEGCNTCFPYRPKSDFYDVLVEYQFNDTLKTSNSLIISK